MDWDGLVDGRNKAPYIPPKETQIDMTRAEKEIKKNVSVAEILAENIKINFKRVNQRKPTIADWDQSF